MKDKPKTATEWLAISEADRGVALAEVLTPGPWKHDMGGYSIGLCHRCNEHGSAVNPTCLVPDPIVIDWNTARRFKGQITNKVFDLALSKVMNAQLNNIGIGYYTQYAIHDAHPYHYLVAAVMAQEQNK